MPTSRNPDNGRFCWVDLAATDARRAQAFYGQLFGWTRREERANGGVFTRLQLADRDVGSVYQLQRMHLERGVPSHWTPYVQVEDVTLAAQRTRTLGGDVLIGPLVIPGLARIAIIADPVGASLGLWESPRPTGGEPG